MSGISVSLGGSDLYAVGGFVLQSFVRPSGRYRDRGIVIPGVDGVQTHLPTAADKDAYDMVLAGFVDGSTEALRSLVLGSCAWRALVFSDQSPKYYQVQRDYVDDDMPGNTDTIVPVEIGLRVSPPCLLGAALVDTTSPVANPGDSICPAEWTITAAGNFTLTVGAVTCAWTGGAGAVVINSETFEVTKDGVPSPQHLRGGYPWLLPGDNAVDLTAGSTFSCTFHPRYA